MPTIKKPMDFEAGKAWFSIMDGVVHGHQRHLWSSTHLHASGGGGAISQGSGRIEPTNYRSTVTQHERTTFWIRDGTLDRQITLNYSFPITDGHSARLIWGAAEGKGSGDYLFVKNNATGRYYNFKNSLGWYNWALSNRLIRMSWAPWILFGSSAFLAYLVHLTAKWPIWRAEGTGVFWFLCILAIAIPLMVAWQIRRSKGRQVCNQVFPLLNMSMK